MAGIELIDIHKTYRVDNREIPVLNGINLSLPTGRITVILGQSGCGKTTLLRLTGGLETADSGEIRWESAHKTAFVFQEPRLMPWLTVWENVVFGLSKKETDPAKIEAVIRTVGLSGFEKAYPAQLSGGMQQRAAIARALADEPPQGHHDGRAVCGPGLFYKGTDAERASARPAGAQCEHSVCDAQYR